MRAHAALAAAALALMGLALLGLAGCARNPADFMAEPPLSPVATSAAGFGAQGVGALGRRSLAAPLDSLYSDPRVGRIGDIVTVVIAINDKATFGNTLGRSQTSSTGVAMDFAIGAGTSGTGPSGTLKTDTSSSSTAQGQGSIDRSEQIQVSVPAQVATILPNGNLVIRGSQEIRVNFELRRLTVEGIVRPTDIGKNNSIAYDRIAEARISYGGSGRLSDVQQPTWGHQLYDAFNPL